MQPSTRRQFLKLGAVLGRIDHSGRRKSVGRGYRVVCKSSRHSVRTLDVVRIGLVGVGGRGTILLDLLLELEGVQIQAVGDLIESRVTRAQRTVEQAGQRRPTGYSRGETRLSQDV